MSEKNNLQPILENSLVLIRPLQQADFEGLYVVASDSEIWEQHPAKERSQREGFTNFFEDAIKTQAAFLIIDKSSEEIIGTSRYHLIEEFPNAIEIGWTFIAKKYWGGKYNKAIKTLMIEHAFQDYENILFYIDKNNIRSQKSVEKIGAERVLSLAGKVLETGSNSLEVFCLNKNTWNYSGA